MGAWGHAPFENDAALDWVDWAVEGDGHAAITTALRAALSADYLDVDDGSAAVAAAAVVAATRDGHVEDLPDKAVELTHDWKPDDALLNLAREALLVVQGERSELASLWGEGAYGASWRSTIERLRERLSH